MFLLPYHLQHIVVDAWHFMLMRIPWLCRLTQKDGHGWLVMSAMITTAVLAEPSALCTFSWFCASSLPLNYSATSATPAITKCHFYLVTTDIGIFSLGLPKESLIIFLTANWRACAPSQAVLLHRQQSHPQARTQKPSPPLTGKSLLPAVLGCSLEMTPALLSACSITLFPFLWRLIRPRSGDPHPRRRSWLDLSVLRVGLWVLTFPLLSESTSSRGRS